MNEIATAIFSLGKTSSRLDKVSILKRHSANAEFKEALRFIFDPYVRTGIAQKKLLKGKHLMKYSSTAAHLSIKDVVDYFKSHQTGSDADIYFAWCFINQQISDEAVKLAIAIVTKDLKVGVTETTLNQVYGDDFIPKIGCMLGDKYRDCKGKVKGPFIVTEKFDGARRILVKENGTVSLYTRKGLPDEGLVDIEREAKHLPDNFVYDGELLAIGEFQDSIALRQATNSIANSDGIRYHVTFNVFDVIPVADFKKGVCTIPAKNRKIMLGAMFGDGSIRELAKQEEVYTGNMVIGYPFQYIKAVPILGIATTEADILEIANPIWQRGFEGVMLNTMNGKYEIKRSKDLLKVKRTEEFVLKVIDSEEGTGKYEGMLGALVVDYKGERVGVGSGFTDMQRLLFWNKRKDLVGKEIELDSFGESTDRFGKVSLNCPIFKRIKGAIE